MPFVRQSSSKVRHPETPVAASAGYLENAITLRATNGLAERINSRIQWIKKMACGFRNRERFCQAIFFHLRGLDLYPAAVKPS